MVTATVTPSLMVRASRGNREPEPHTTALLAVARSRQPSIDGVEEGGEQKGERVSSWETTPRAQLVRWFCV